MKLITTLAASVSLAAVIFAPLRARADFAQSESDLRPDPAVRFGQLSNGVNYVIEANHIPEDRASYRLIVDAGSFNETDDQQGIAHFLAHMAFRGSTHYQAGAMVQLLQKWGMSADPENNSDSDFDHTTYMLELPDTRATTLKEGFQVFADIAGGLTLSNDQIESERPEILHEKLDRGTMAYRDQLAELRFTLPDTLIADRLPIGMGSVIGAAKRDTFVDFYNTWYRPEKLTVVAVGDFDPSDIETMIRDAFGGLKDRAPARPDPKLGDIAVATGLKVKFIPEPQLGGVKISIETIRPYYHEADTAALRQQLLYRGLAFAMLNRRLAAETQKSGSPILSASADVGELFDFVHNASLQLACKPDQWRAALTAGEQTLHQALQYGFQPAELQYVSSIMRRSLDQLSNSAAGRSSARVADGIVASLLRRQVVTSPAENAGIYGTDLSHITVDDCDTALRQAWAAKGTYLVVTGNLALDHPSQDLAEAYQAAYAAPISPPAPIVQATFPYSSFGTPATVVSQKEISDLGITEVVFSNGVRLNLKSTTFEPGKIDISVRVGGGGLTEPADAKPGLARYTEGVFLDAGLGRISAQDLRQALAGRLTDVDFRVLDDAFSFAGATDPVDLMAELRLITAYISDPGYRPEAMERAAQAIPQMYQELERTPDAPLTTSIARVMANGDPRFGLPAENELMSRNLGEVKAWIGPQLAHGALEIAMVGDFQTAAAIDAVAHTLGELPQREAKPAYTVERDITFPDKPVANTYPASPGITDSTVILVWPTTDGLQYQVAHRLGILAEIYSQRLRAKLGSGGGDVPPPVARSVPSTAYPAYGTLTAEVVCDAPQGDLSAGRQKAIEATRTMLMIASAMYSQGVTDAEMQRAKQAAIQVVNDSAGTNAYWLDSVLADAQEFPKRLDWARSRYDDVAQISRAEIDDFAAQFLDPKRASRFLITPQ